MNKRVLSYQAVGFRLAFVVAVLAVSLLPGVSVVASLIGISIAVTAFSLAAIWVPVDRWPLGGAEFRALLAR